MKIIQDILYKILFKIQIQVNQILNSINLNKKIKIFIFFFLKPLFKYNKTNFKKKIKNTYLKIKMTSLTQISQTKFLEPVIHRTFKGNTDTINSCLFNPNM